MKKEEIIQLRESFLPPKKAGKLQKQLIRIYKKEYKPKHKPSIYYKLIIDYKISEIKERSPQNSDYADVIFECFSTVSQRVKGYTKEHCLDQIYDAVKRKKQRIKEYKKLPTLKELVDSNITIDKDKTYYTKERETYEDSCDDYSGDIILEIREIGMEKFRKKRVDEFFKMMFDYDVKNQEV